MKKTSCYFCDKLKQPQNIEKFKEDLITKEYELTK